MMAMAGNEDTNTTSNEDNNKEETEERPTLPDSSSAERVSTDTEATDTEATSTSFEMYKLHDHDSTPLIDQRRDLPVDGWGRPHPFSFCKCNKEPMNNDGNK